MKFESEAHSLIFYTSDSGTENPCFFENHEYETSDKDAVEALKSDRAKKSGIKPVSRQPKEKPETPATPPAQ